MNPRDQTTDQLLASFAEARRQTLAAALDLDDAQWLVPYDPGIQPVAWDLAHIGWFHEFWLLRGPHTLGPDGHGRATQPPRFFGPDEHYDSARVSHPERWRMPLFGRGDLLDRLAAQADACAAAVRAGDDDPSVRYFAHLSVLHELMHVEALWWTRALLGLPAGRVPRPQRSAAPGDAAEQVAVPTGEHRLGFAPDGDEREFAFDNERPGRTVRLAAFTIDRDPVTNARFAAFVDAGGYARPEFWPGDATRFRERLGRDLPARWRRAADGSLEQRWFERWLPLVPDEPVLHVSAFEAEAFCRYAGRRLPTAAEWEAAQSRITWGRSAWEWTSSPFAPYPGFRPGPYTTYSAPWFHHQRELRGGAFATHALVHDHRYRNFFAPRRTDVFVGFRTARDA
jgi:gamma-glutamyl hercynylcysteine S-oxide synthase